MANVLSNEVMRVIMIKLKKLVLFREYNYANIMQDKPSIEDNKFVLPADLANEIADYLEDEKYLLLQFVSPTSDPYNPNEYVPHIICSDGTFAWDGVIIHWIRKYCIKLPDDFLYHFEQMKKNPVSSPDLKNSPLLELVKESELVYV